MKNQQREASRFILYQETEVHLCSSCPNPVILSRCFNCNRFIAFHIYLLLKFITSAFFNIQRCHTRTFFVFKIDNWKTHLISLNEQIFSLIFLFIVFAYYFPFKINSLIGILLSFFVKNRALVSTKLLVVMLAHTLAEALFLNFFHKEFCLNLKRLVCFPKF